MNLISTTSMLSQLPRSRRKIINLRSRKTISLTQKNRRPPNPTNFPASPKSSHSLPSLARKKTKSLKMSMTIIKKSMKKWKKSRVLPKNKQKKLQRKVIITKSWKTSKYLSLSNRKKVYLKQLINLQKTSKRSSSTNRLNK